jgi:hypothetical protein
MATNNETKRIPAIEAEIIINAEQHPCALRLAFANGERLSITAGQLQNSIMEYAIFHGLKQKLVDAAAISRNPETGRAATIEDKYQAVKTVYDRLLAGQWNAIREGGAGNGGLLFKALCRLYPNRSPESIMEYLAAKSDKEKTALRGNAKVAAMIETIREETGKTANVDTDAMLGELE